MLRSIAYSLLLANTALGNPLTSEDVRRERTLIAKGLAQEKAQAAELFRASQNVPLLRRVTAGVSVVENKLASADTTSRQELADVETRNLEEQQLTLHAPADARTYSAHHPTNSLACYLDVNGRKNPETFLPREELQRGANVLVPWQTIDAPACLAAAELEGYIRMRCDLKFKTGDYWSQLHASRLNDEQLAHLRYYDYLDLHAPRRPVLVYRCTELRGRNH